MQLSFSGSDLDIGTFWILFSVSLVLLVADFISKLQARTLRLNKQSKTEQILYAHGRLDLVALLRWQLIGPLDIQRLCLAVEGCGHGDNVHKRCGQLPHVLGLREVRVVNKHTYHCHAIRRQCTGLVAANCRCITHCFTSSKNPITDNYLKGNKKLCSQTKFLIQSKKL